MSSQSQALSARAEFTRNLFVEYEAIRGKKPDADGGGGAFWDMVVISAGAESQKSWYEEQARTTIDMSILLSHLLEDFSCYF